MNGLIHGVGFCYWVIYLTFVKIQCNMVRASIKQYYIITCLETLRKTKEPCHNM